MACWRQAIIWTNAEILLIWPLETNFSEILIEIDIFTFNKMHLKLSSARWQPFCLGLNVCTQDFSNSTAIALDLLQSYDKPLAYFCFQLSSLCERDVIPLC